MQLQNIDKQQYRKHLNIVIVGFIVTLLILSLTFGQLLISAFSNVSYSSSTFDVSVSQAQPQAPSDEVNQAPSNFKYNLLGVILALLACASILHSLKNKAFFNEIYYVWQLKQLQNLIYRKLKRIETKATQGDVNALITLSYYYQSLKQVYTLDDNTITLSKVEKDIQRIDTLAEDQNVTIELSSFDKALLANF